jgi:hypothetical protein
MLNWSAGRHLREQPAPLPMQADKKLAITVFSFPPDKGNVGTAAYLNVFGSMFRVLQVDWCPLRVHFSIMKFVTLFWSLSCLCGCVSCCFISLLLYRARGICRQTVFAWLNFLSILFANLPCHIP